MGREQGGEVTPEVGLWNGARSDGTVAHGAILGYRVNDVAAVAVRVRSAGGATKDPQERPYGLESDCVDNQGVSFYLHQLLDTPTDDDGDLANGRQHGDVGYMSLGVPELALAEGFYGEVLGWTFTPGSHAQGRQIGGVTPMSGLWQTDAPGAVLAYRVDDIQPAVAQVGTLGGTASSVEERPYGLAADNCVDDQGTIFHLLQLR
jgi:predicted enzyme related to lactoylglutathione lyase